MDYMPNNHMFNFMSSVFPVIFLIAFGVILFGIFKRGLEWHNNNQQPILDIESQVVSKRSETSNHVHNNNGTLHQHSNTSYFVTFEVESGDRLELQVTAQQFGLLAEADKGKLRFQGTRYLGFERYR